MHAASTRIASLRRKVGMGIIKVKGKGRREKGKRMPVSSFVGFLFSRILSFLPFPYPLFPFPLTFPFSLDKRQ
jgi:hypothetical protein